MTKKLNVIIYRNLLLPPAEPYVRNQAEALQQFVSYYVGSRFVQGLTLPAERTLVVNQGGLPGKMSEIFYMFFGLAPAFFEEIRKLNPVLIHAHFGPDGVSALPLAWALQIPLVVTFHGFDATVKDEYSWRSRYNIHRLYLLRRKALRREACLFIAVSKFIKERLLQQGFPPDKIVVHYIGVDTEFFQPAPAEAHGSIVLFVGRLVEKKGCEYLIQAMSKVEAAKPEVELILIGDGPLRSSLEQLAHKKLQRYRFLGMLPPDAVRTWMSRARVFSVPSVTAKSGNSEGFGIVFAEAQAMGLPVVSFATGGVPEAVAHGETGFLVPERDWEGLAKYILLLLEDDMLWHRFREAGQSRVRTLFNLQKQTSALEDLYKQVLSNRGNSSTTRSVER